MNMIKSEQMKPRSSVFPGIMLCTCFSPLPLPVGEDPPKIVLVYGPPQLPDPVKWNLYFKAFEKFEKNEFYEPDPSLVLSVKPVSWFIHKNIPLCLVRTIPYEYEPVYKPPQES